RALAGLHVLHEARVGGIGDVVDADAGHVILRVRDATLRAIRAVARAFRGQEEQVAIYGRVALRGDAGDRRRDLRFRGIADVPNREAGEVALVDVMVLEGEIGVDEGQAARRVEGRRLGRE